MMECRNDKDKALRELMRLDFAINDFALYLDTHPENMEALKKHREYSNKYNMQKEEYEKKYGPLTIYSNLNNTNNWEWIDEPWPWERGAY